MEDTDEWSASEDLRIRQRVAFARIGAANREMWNMLDSMSAQARRELELQEFVERQRMARNERETIRYEMPEKKRRTLAQEPIAPYF